MRHSPGATPRSTRRCPQLRKEIADQLGASRTMFHAGTVEIPIRLIQSVGDAVVLSVPVDGLREVLPGEGEPASAH